MQAIIFTHQGGIYIALCVDLECEDFFPSSLMVFYSSLTCVFMAKLVFFC